METEITRLNSTQAGGGTKPSPALAARGPAKADGAQPDPDVFQYLDYRLYLRDLQSARRAQGRPHSAAAFSRRGRIASANYWGLVLSGKRNLSHSTVLKFSQAAGLEGRAALYFENLVFFNQAQNANDKALYFSRLAAVTEGREGKLFRLMSNHYKLFSSWHTVAIRELVATRGFRESSDYIVRRLRGRITRKQAEESLALLLEIGLLRRDPATGRLEQAEAHVDYPAQGVNFVVRKYHHEVLERAKESLAHDPVEERFVNSVALSCQARRLPEIAAEVDEFRNHIALKYGRPDPEADAVIQVGVQVFSLTELEGRGKARTNDRGEKEKGK